jgi:hypothetical protein
MISILLELDEGERSVETGNESEDEFEEKGKNKTSPKPTLGEECEISIDMFFDHQGIALCGKVGSWERRVKGLIQQIRKHGKQCNKNSNYNY